MTRQELEQFGAARGYRVLGDSAFGAYKGYPFRCVRAARGQCTVFVTLGDKLSGAVFRATRGELKPLRAVLQRSHSMGVMLLLRAKTGSEEFNRNFTEAMDVLIRALREAGLAPSKTCPLCKREGCDSMAYVKGEYVPVHQDCLAQAHQATVESGERNRVQGSYVTGFIGALLGGAVGTLPTVIVALTMSRVYAMLYALIPLCAYLGYKLLRGKLNRAAFVCTVVSSLINLLSIEYFQLYYQFASLYGTLFSPAQVGRVWWEMLLSGNLSQGLMYSVIFIALGLWVSWRFITQTAAGHVDATLNMLSTAQPLDGVPKP